MSQVLIGIMGVVLFIALAIAGAMFLGGQFQNSANTGRGSAMVQAVTQVASAAAMFKVQEGTEALEVTELLNLNYLKTSPVNVSGGDPAVLVTSGDAATTTGGATKPSYVKMEIDGPSAIEICSAVNKQTGGPNPPLETLTLVDNQTETSTSGCYGSAAFGYYVYAVL